MPSTNCICKDFAKTWDLILYFKKSMISLSDAINAPVLAKDLAKVAKYTSISSCTPCSSPAPAPVLPRVPNP